MPTYMLLTDNGTTPPRYEHPSLASAQAEAARLALLHNTRVRILEVVGQVEIKEVPITERKPIYTPASEVQRTEDDMPF